MLTESLQSTKGRESQCFSSCAPSTPAHSERECTAVVDFCEGALNTYQNSKESDICKFTFLKAWVLVPLLLAYELNTCFPISLQWASISFSPPLFSSCLQAYFVWGLWSYHSRPGYGKQYKPKEDRVPDPSIPVKEPGWPALHNDKINYVEVLTVLKYWLSKSFLEVCACSVTMTKALWEEVHLKPVFLNIHYIHKGRYALYSYPYIHTCAEFFLLLLRLWTQMFFCSFSPFRGKEVQTARIKIKPKQIRLFIVSCIPLCSLITCSS